MTEMKEALVVALMAEDYDIRLLVSDKLNRPFPSLTLPHFQNESSCKTIQMKMSLICIKMDVQVIFMFI